MYLQKKIYSFFSIFSIVLLLISISFSLYIMIEFREAMAALEDLKTDEQNTQLNKIAVLKIVDPYKVVRIEKFSRYQFYNCLFLGFSLILFFVTGIPNIKKTLADPGRLFKLSENEKRIIKKIFNR